MSGIDPQAGSKMGNLSHSIIAGEYNLSGRGVIVGSIFADNLHLWVGDHLSIYSAREIKKMKEARDRKEDEAILPDDYEVRGIFDVGYYEDDARYITVSLENAQDLYGLDDSVHGLYVMLADPYPAAQTVKDQLTNTAGRRFLCVHLDGTKFHDAQRPHRGEERHVLSVVFHRDRGRPLHFERH